MTRRLVKHALLRTPGINMNLCVTKQRPQGIINKVLSQVIEAVPEWSVYEADGYWPLYDFALSILRSSSGNFQTANRNAKKKAEAGAQGAIQEAPQGQAVQPARKPRGRPRRKGNPEPTPVQVALPSNNDPDELAVDAPPTHEANNIADTAEDDMEGVVAGEAYQPAASPAPFADGWDPIHELEKSMGNASICMKDPEGEMDIADAGLPQANILPAELSIRPVFQTLPPRIQPASTPASMPLSGRVSGSAAAPPHTSVSTTTATATSTATAMSTSTASSTATYTDPMASTRRPPPASTPKSPGEMVNAEMGAQLQEILTLPKDVAQQRFPWIFEHLAALMASKPAGPLRDSEVEPDPPSDTELGPCEDIDASSDLSDEHLYQAPFGGENNGGGNSSSRGNSGGRGKRGKQGGGRGGGRGGGGGMVGNPAPKTRSKATPNADGGTNAGVGVAEGSNTRVLRVRGAGKEVSAPNNSKAAPKATTTKTATTRSKK
ncbi:hypothetical protein FS749_008823 [Ceratobasidium sp. UAMH 11750]|nr:hypothetical protein FS749_008823 [Ceratobasidium sp. UAMH 11750]